MTRTPTRADITPEALFWNRRRVIAAAASGLGLGSIGGAAFAADDLEPTAWDDITGYNNFYEFGTGKTDPAKNADALQTSPWSIKIGGMVDTPMEISFEEIAQEFESEEHIYRFRCVEAWSMVVPWNGFSLSKLLDKAGVQDTAKYVAFETAVQPENMIGVRQGVLNFPYREGLRLDEAMHPLTLMATGIYGKPMPNQNGAPIRLVVPWKYGFKSIKSIVAINLVDEQPVTTWNELSAKEYGFYSNVNPNVDHPRWSQASHRVIGSGLFGGREDTLMFNGYEDEVAALYEGMDLTEQY